MDRCPTIRLVFALYYVPKPLGVNSSVVYFPTIIHNPPQIEDFLDTCSMGLRRILLGATALKNSCKICTFRLYIKVGQIPFLILNARRAILALILVGNQYVSNP